MGVVRRRHHDGSFVESVERLDQGIDHALDLAKLTAVVALFGYGVDFVDEQEARPVVCEVEQGADVLGGVAQQRRNHGIQTHDVEGQAQS
ncbi:hypothetical protein D3C86_1384840 [compost metagenome]